MSNLNQNPYPDDREREGPVDESGLVGEFDAPNNTGLAGTPNPPDNSGLAGSGQIDTADNAGLLDNTSGPSRAGVYGEPTTGPSNTSNTGTLGSGVDGMDYTGQQSGELPDQQLLQPGYNPQVGDAGRLQDLEREGPNPTGYTGMSDRDAYANQNDEYAASGPDADMRPNDTDQQAGY